MSIFIKGMEMPEDGMIGVFISSDRNVYDSMDNIIGTIVPVPTPHGQLKDADSFGSIKYDMFPRPRRYEQGFYDGVRYAQHLIIDAPTVIEAEE